MNKKIIGKTGEEVAGKYLLKRGYDIVATNYAKKWGELDIIARKDGKLCFVEVKSVTYTGVIGEPEKGEYRPEDKVTASKLKKIGRTIQSYLMEENILDAEWDFLAIVVKLNLQTRMARVHMVPAIVS